MTDKILPQKFYARSTVEVAQALLGMTLVYETPEEGRVSGKIVETEAYLFVDDPACHASRGKTARNAVMFGKAGYAYIYFVYGMHYCVNVVTADEGVGEAVLIRALEPLEGIPVMERRRNSTVLKNLTNGPGKLVQALGLTREQNGLSLREGPLTIRAPRGFKGHPPIDIEISKRIGINVGADLMLRFHIKGNRFVSR